MSAERTERHPPVPEGEDFVVFGGLRRIGFPHQSAGGQESPRFLFLSIDFASHRCVFKQMATGTPLLAVEQVSGESADFFFG